MAETPEHKNAKNTICDFFSKNYGTALTEYLDSGFEADVSAVLFPVRKIMVEVIWSKSKQNFYRDLTLVLSSDAEIKIVVVNPEILQKPDFVRYFGRIKQTEAAKGYSYIGLVPWNFDNNNVSLQVIKAELDTIIQSRKGKISGSIREVKEDIFNKRISLPVIVSKCQEIATRTRGEKTKPNGCAVSCMAITVILKARMWVMRSFLGTRISLGHWRTNYCFRKQTI